MNNKTKKTIIMLIFVVSILTIIGTISYAYFSAMADVTNQDVTFQIGTMALTFDDNDQGFSKEMSLGESVTKEFKIKNTGTLDATTNLLWYNLTNTYLAKSLSYKLEYKTTPSEDWSSLETSKSNVPRSMTPDTYNLATDLLIPATKEYYYRLTIKFENLDINQNSDKKAILNTKFIIGDSIAETNNVLVERDYNNFDELIWEHSEEIKEIIFERTINPPTGYTLTYDLTDPSSDGTVTSYLVPSGTVEIEFWDEEKEVFKTEERTAYIAYIQANGKIKANENSSYLFGYLTNLESITGLENLDTSNVISMEAMFAGCSSLTTLNLRSFDTSNVISMEAMFVGCSSLTTLDLNNFNTSNVISMSHMFNWCFSLTALNLRSFDTSNVIEMGEMFASCTSLTTLDLSNFDISNVTYMTGMFFNCTSLTTLNLPNFDVTKVTYKEAMFNSINPSVKIRVSNDTLKQWVISVSDDPKFTSDNFVIGYTHN